MALTGGCYCGAVRYEAEGEPSFRGECYCRQCRYISGGNSNLFIVMPAAGFRYTASEPAKFSRTDIERPVTREFCPSCGTHLTTLPRPGGPIVVVKLGTLDEAAPIYPGPDMVYYKGEAETYHRMPEGVVLHDKMPGRK